jgi:hypothetical protein
MRKPRDIADRQIALVVLIFFGPMKRTVAMTTVATMDLILAILFVPYLVA